MTLDEVIILIQTWIIQNGNEEITADVLRPILEAMVNQPNALIGDLDNLTTSEKDNLVEAINEVRTLADTNAGLVIHTGSGTPMETPPVSFGVGDFYAQIIFPSSAVVTFWQYNGSVWVQQRPQRTRTVLKFVSLVGITVTGKSQVEWMAEAIELNIANGAVYECEPGDIIDFFINLVNETSGGTPTIRRVFTRLLTGATSVTSVTPNDLMPDGSEDVIIDPELIIELGDIGTSNVWDAFNADPSQPFDMDNEMFVSAVQDSEPKLWQWIGGTGTFGNTATPAVEGDFLDLTEQPPVTTYNLFKQYLSTTAMIADQSTQIAQQAIEVFNASDDPNITFAVGETKLQAYYRKIGASTTGTIDDYRLISAPYSKGNAPFNTAKSLGGTTETTPGINDNTLVGGFGIFSDTPAAPRTSWDAIDLYPTTSENSLGLAGHVMTDKVNSAHIVGGRAGYYSAVGNANSDIAVNGYGSLTFTYGGDNYNEHLAGFILSMHSDLMQGLALDGVTLKGSHGFILGGSFHQIAGDYSGSIGGQMKQVFALQSVAIGGKNIKIGTLANVDSVRRSAIIGGNVLFMNAAEESVMLGGFQNTATGNHNATIGGQDVEMAALRGISLCARDSEVSAEGAAAHGRGVKANIINAMTKSSGSFATRGDSQTHHIECRRSAVGPNVFLSVSGGGGTDLFTPETNTTGIGVFEVVIQQSGISTSNMAAYVVKFAYSNIGGTLTIKGQTLEVIFEDNAAFNAAAEIVGTGTRLGIRVTAPDTNTYRATATGRIVVNRI